MKIVISLADGATAAKISHISGINQGGDIDEQVENVYVLSEERSQCVIDVAGADLLQIVDFA